MRSAPFRYGPAAGEITDLVIERSAAAMIDVPSDVELLAGF